MSYIEISAKTVDEALRLGVAKLEEKELEFDHSEVLENPSSGFLGFGKKDAKVRIYYKGDEILDTEPNIEDMALTMGKVAKSTYDEGKEIVEEALETGKEKIENVAEVGKEKIEEVVENAKDMIEDVEETFEKDLEKKKEIFISPEQQAVVAEKGKQFLQNMIEKMGLSVIIEKMISTERIVLHVHGDDLGILIGKHGQTLDSIQYLVNLVANKGEVGHCHIMVDVENYRSRREKTLQQLAKRYADKVKRNRRRVSLEPMNAYERKIIHMALQDIKHISTYSSGEGSARHIVIEYVK